MLENEFEKQVQLKMKEFDLHPSEEVWMEVERRIRKEKKRRFIFWWLFLFLLLGGGIIAGIWFTNKKEKAGEITAKDTTSKELQSPPVKTIVPKPAQGLTDNDTRDIPGSRNDTAILKEDNSETKMTSGNGVKTRLPGNKPAVKQPARIKKQKINNPVITKETIVITEKQKKDQDKKPVVTIVVQEKPVVDLTDSAKVSVTAVVGKKDMQQKKEQEPALKITDSIKKNQNNKPAVTIVVPLKPAVDLTDSTKVGDIAIEEKKDLQQRNQEEPAPKTTDSINKEQKTKPTDKKPKKWDWGITFSGGRSTENNFRFFNNSLFFDNSAALTRNTRLNTSSSAWAAGVYVKRSVAKKLDLHIGLGYLYLSTKNNVGSRVDSVRTINNPNSGGLTINNFYRSATPADNSAYTNQYHFMSLSGELSWRIITGKKIKVYWENGLSYNRLLSSTMLHYTGVLPGYYKDNRLLNKNQIFISTGFSIPVSARVMINPFVSYGLTPVLKNTNSERTNFTNFGIRVRVLLNRK